MREIQYIYTLSSPEEPEIVKYVGYTNNPNKRLNKHYTDSLKGKSKVKCWVKGLRDKGMRPIMTVIDSFQTVEEVWEAEIAYIKLFKSFGAHLKNLTTGGEGSTGHKHSTEAREKISQAAITTAIKKGLNISGKKQKPVSERTKKIVKNEIDEGIVKSYFLQGMSPKEIAEKYNYYISHVKSYINKLEYDIKERPKYIKYFITYTQLHELYINENKTKKEIAKITGLTERNIKKRLIDFGIKKTPDQSKELRISLIEKRKSISDEIGELIKIDNQLGMKPNDLSKKYGVSVSKIYNFLAKSRKK